MRAMGAAARRGTLAIPAVLASVLAGWLLAVPARAEHFNLNVTVKSANGGATASWDTSPPEGGFNPRPVAEASAGEEITIEWSAASTYPHGTMKAVGIRLYVAPETRIGQKQEPTAPRILDNRFTADFAPNYRSHGHLRFRVPKPGHYLVRLQTEGTRDDHGHEHFAAVDLKVD